MPRCRVASRDARRAAYGSSCGTSARSIRWISAPRWRAVHGSAALLRRRPLAGILQQPLPSEGAFTSASRRRVMLLILAIVCIVAWALGFTVFHVASAAIHLLLLLAVIGLVVHFMRAAST